MAERRGIQPVLMRPPPAICQNLAAGGGGVGRVWHVALGGGGELAVGGGYWRYSRGGGFPGQGGGGFLNTMQFPRLSNFSRSIVAMVCH